VKDKRTGKDGDEFLIGWCDFPLDKDDTWEPINNLPLSEHMIADFNNQFAEDYKIKTTAEFQSVIDKRNTANKKMAKKARDRNTTGDMTETFFTDRMHQSVNLVL
jgi:hypothetical protein